MPLTSIHRAILAAVASDPRSARRISIDATENDSTIRNLKRGVDAQISTVSKIAESLGLEFYLAPRDDESLAMHEVANLINAHMQATKDRFLQENSRSRNSAQPTESSESLPPPDPEIAHRLLEYRTGEASDGHVALRLDLEQMGRLVSLLTPAQARDMSAHLAHMALEVEQAQSLDDQKAKSQGAA